MSLKASPHRSSETTTQRIAEKHIHTCQAKREWHEREVKIKDKLWVGQKSGNKRTLKSKYAHKYVRGGRVTHYMQRLPIRWPHGEWVTWKQRSLATQHLDIYVVISTSQDLILVMFLISFWLETQQQPVRRISKVRKDVFMWNFFFIPTFALAFIYSCVYLLYNTIKVRDVISCQWNTLYGWDCQAFTQYDPFFFS